MSRSNRTTTAVLPVYLIVAYGLEGLVPHDTRDLLLPRFTRSEILGFVGGFGTTFAGRSDLVTMLKRRSTAGMKPRMAAIMGGFQILWDYYRLLIGLRPAIAQNRVAALFNFQNAGAHRHFARKEGFAQ